jgi:serine/threonine protein kinase
MAGTGGKIQYGLDPSFYPGIKYIARLLDEIDENKDFWLVYEVGSSSLGKHLFEVKGEFYKGERIYLVAHQAPFYAHLKFNKNLLRQLIKKTTETFRVLSELKIVHADIKPDNLLISYDPDRQLITDLKLIDFGSAFSFDCPSNIQASTPEYLAPEVLEYLENRAKNT